MRDRRPCPGCRRKFDVHFEFLQNGVKVIWTYADGKGHFCKCCFTVWRTLYRHVRSLTLMTPWLDIEQNFYEFQLGVLAFVMLKQDRLVNVYVSLRFMVHKAENSISF